MDRSSRRRSREVAVKVETRGGNSRARAPVTVKSETDVAASSATKTDDVEDVTEQVKTQKEKERKRKADEEAIDLSSEEEEEEAESDFQVASDDEDEGSDAWDDDGVEESDDEPIEVEEEIPGDEEDNKLTRVPPLEVAMEEKDMPVAPGKPSLREDGNDAELEEGSTLVNNSNGRTKAARAVKDRIIKLLNTGFHDQSNEHEAKNAMKLAQRLMKKYDLSQAVLLKEREVKNEKEQASEGTDEILKGGIVRVQIVNRRTRKVAVMARWIGELVHPICKNFDVKSFHSVKRGWKCEVSFYGIFTNCQLAAYAFKVATERISQMCDEYKPEKPQQPMFPWEKKVGTKSSRLSYGLGIVEGIDRDVDRNIRMEKEERERKLERARMAANQGELYDDSDGEECWQDGISVASDTKVAKAFDPEVYAATDGNFDDANVGTLFDHEDDASALSTLERVKRDLAKKIVHLKKDEGPTWIKEQKAYWKARLPKEEFKDVWKPAKDYAFDVWEVSRQKEFPKSRSELEAARRAKRLKEIEKEKEAAIVLVNHREKVADQVLKSHNIKLSSGRKRSSINFDRRSYNRGMEDAKEIDINQRAIRDGVRVKRERKRHKR